MMTPETPSNLDYIAFTEPTSEAAASVRRFGDDPAYAEFFADLKHKYAQLRVDADFFAELDRQLLRSGRLPSPLQHAVRLSESIGGAQVFFKREDLSQGRGPLLLNVIASALVARRLGKTTLVTGIARGKCAYYTASVAAHLGLKARIFVDEQFEEKHAIDMMRMRLMGAHVEVQNQRYRRFDDIREVALAYADAHIDQAFLMMGLEAAPEPYPQMQHDFASVLGRETLRQLADQGPWTPHILVCRGGNRSDAIGYLSAYVEQPEPRLVCVEARSELGLGPSPPTPGGAPLDPARSALSEHQKRLAQGILAGQDYVSVAREHSALRASGRVEYVEVKDEDARQIIARCAQLEGYVSPIETAQVIAWSAAAATTLPKDSAIVALLSEDAERGMWDVGRLFIRKP